MEDLAVKLKADFQSEMDARIAAEVTHILAVSDTARADLLAKADEAREAVDHAMLIDEITKQLALARPTLDGGHGAPSGGGALHAADHATLVNEIAKQLALSHPTLDGGRVLPRPARDGGREPPSDDDGSEDGSYTDGESLMEEELRNGARGWGFIEHKSENRHYHAGSARHNPVNRPSWRPLFRNKSFAIASNNGRATGTIAKALVQFESLAYDLRNVVVQSLDLVRQLHEDGEQESTFFGDVARLANTTGELYNLVNRERCVLAARADAVGPKATEYTRNFAAYVVNATAADSNAPADMDTQVDRLRRQYSQLVDKADARAYAYKGSNGGGGGGSGGYARDRSDKARPKPKPKPKDKRSARDADKGRRGSPRGERRDSNQRESRRNPPRGGGGHKSDGGKAHRGDDRGGGRGGGGGGRGGGRADNDRRRHSETTRQGQRATPRRGAHSDADSDLGVSH